MTSSLIIFGRIPDMNIPAKTGLGKEINNEIAARKIGHDLTTQTLETCKNLPYKKYFCYGGEQYLEQKTVLNNFITLQNKYTNYQFFSQNNSEKSDVMGIQDAFNTILRNNNVANNTPNKIIIIGTDIIGLDHTVIEECFYALETYDACIVPVEDKGYGLIGISKNIDIVSEIKNFNSRTKGYNLVQETKELCRAKNISLFVNPKTCFDIDTQYDAKRANLL